MLVIRNNNTINLNNVRSFWLSERVINFEYTTSHSSDCFRFKNETDAKLAYDYIAECYTYQGDVVCNLSEVK